MNNLMVNFKLSVWKVMDSVLVKDSICLSHFITKVEIHHPEGIGGLKLHNNQCHLPRLVLSS